MTQTQFLSFGAVLFSVTMLASPAMSAASVCRVAPPDLPYSEAIMPNGLTPHPDDPNPPCLDPSGNIVPCSKPWPPGIDPVPVGPMPLPGCPTWSNSGLSEALQWTTNEHAINTVTMGEMVGLAKQGWHRTLERDYVPGSDGSDREWRSGHDQTQQHDDGGGHGKNGRDDVVPDMAAPSKAIWAAKTLDGITGTMTRLN